MHEIITDPNKLPEVFATLATKTTVAVDCETTGLDFVRDTMHGFSLSAEGMPDYYITGTALYPALDALKQFISENAGVLWVGHNIKFDMHFFAKFSVYFPKYADTIVAAWLCDENRDLGLKDLAHSYLGITDPLPDYKELLKETKKDMGVARMDMVSIYDIPLEKLGEYAARDTALTLRLWYRLMYDMATEEVENIFWNVEMPFLKMLFEMEEYGMEVSPNKVSELEMELALQRDAALGRWMSITGGINPRSAKQVGTFLFETLKMPIQGLTKGGQPSVDDLVLQRLMHMENEKLDEEHQNTGPVASLREYRKAEKLISTYIEMLRTKSFEGRIHGSFNQTGAATGRLSSSDPNLQNIPSRGDLGKAMRKVFVAKEGYVLVVGDWSQIELRLLASESNDRPFLEVFESGGDAHQRTADDINGPRHAGKTINFLWGFGGGPKVMANYIEKSGLSRPPEAQCKTWLTKFDDSHPAMGKWKLGVVNRARQLGYVPTIIGPYGRRKRRLPDLNTYDRALRGAAERQCVNARIQGSAADMLKHAMLMMAQWAPTYGVRITATVHDEVVCEVPAQHAEAWKEIMRLCMVSIKDTFKLRVPIDASIESGDNWGACK